MTPIHQPAPGSENRAKPATLPRSPIEKVRSPIPVAPVFKLRSYPSHLRDSHSVGLGAAQERARDRHSPKQLGHGGPTHIGRVNPTASWPHNRGRKGISQSHLQRASSAPAGTERTCCPPGRRGLLNCGLHLVCGVSLWGPRRTLPRSKRRGSWLSPGPPPPLSPSTERAIMSRSPGQPSSTCS